MAINETVRPRWSSGIAGEWWWSRLARLARCRRRVRRLHLRVVVSLVTAALFSGTAQAPALSASRETVVLIHGLGGNAWNFQLLAGHLERAGYSVRRLEYDSRAESLDLILEEVDRQIAACCLSDATRVHFVTHSLGSLVLRAHLAGHRPPGLGRVVMLAPSNQGTEIADRVGGWRLTTLLAGPLASQLGTGEDDLPRRLPDLDTEFGVVAGSRWVNPLGPLMLKGPHDGTVPVASTRLRGMADHVVVPSSHLGMLGSKQVAAATVRFLQSGRFDRALTVPSEAPR